MIEKQEQVAAEEIETERERVMEGEKENNDGKR